MKDDYGSLLRSVVLREVMQERGNVEQRRRRFAQSIADARKQTQKQRAASTASEDFNERASAMRSVFEATRSPSDNQPSARPSAQSRAPPQAPPSTKLKISEEELRMHMTDLFTRRVPEKSEAPSGQGLSLIFNQDLQKSSPKAKRLDIFERKRRIRDANAVWSLLERIKERARISHRSLSLRLNSPFKGLHQEILSELSLAHHGKIHARRDTK